MIILENVVKRMGTRVLFENVNMIFKNGNRYGLTGPNGAGKSTLMKIMMGEVESTSGQVKLPKKVGFLRQDLEPYQDMRVYDVVIMGNKVLWKVLQEQEELYAKGDMTDEEGIRLGELSEVVLEEDGYVAEGNAEILLKGMGISEDSFEQPLKELPSSDQFKVLLCQALFGDPEALLLDEPTNHLDIESIAWLENFLKNYNGSLVVISHNRHFLNSVTTHIADIDYETIIDYTGNYDDMVLTKTKIRSREMHDIKSKEKKISQLQDFVAKFGSGTRASQAQSRKKEMDKLKPEELKRTNITRPYVRFEEPDLKPGHSILKLGRITKQYDNTPNIFENFSLEITRDEKIAVIGKNGAGKTTLLKIMAGIIPPTSGNYTLGHNVDLGYMPQEHHDLVDKSENIAADDWLRMVRPNTSDNDVRRVLGRMLFSGEEAEKPIAGLSGGETARLILCKLDLCKHNFLVLDEPENHLDLESISALGEGLKGFPGTLIFASHDRDLVTTVADKIISFDENGPRIFHGGYEEYIDHQDSSKS